MFHRHHRPATHPCRHGEPRAEPGPLLHGVRCTQAHPYQDSHYLFHPRKNSCLLRLLLRMMRSYPQKGVRTTDRFAKRCHPRNYTQPLKAASPLPGTEIPGGAVVQESLNCFVADPTFGSGWTQNVSGQPRSAFSGPNESRLHVQNYTDSLLNGKD